MGMQEKIQRIDDLKTQLLSGGGTGAIASQQGTGRLTCRERIEKLLDPGTFCEIELFLKPNHTGHTVDRTTQRGDGLVAGYGRINQRSVCVWAQDITVSDGRMGILQASRIVTVLERALKGRMPCLGILDSRGLRAEDFICNPTNYAYDRIAFLMTRMSGVVPQLSLIMGPCVGPAAICAQLADFVFMVKDSSYASLCTPGAGRSPEKAGSAMVHFESSGCCDVLAETDEACLQKARELMGFLPRHNNERTFNVSKQDDPLREVPELLDIVPSDSKKSYQVQEVIRAIADEHLFFETRAGWAPNLVVGFAHLGGMSCGIIANNPDHKGGCLDVDSADKLARFVLFCDAFNLPLLYLADTPAFLPSIEEEHKGIIRHGAKAIFANSVASVPQIQVYLRKCYGGGTLAMPGNTLGADFALGWPTTELLLMNPQGAVSIIHRKEIAASEDPKAAFKKRLEEFLSGAAAENIWEAKRVQDFIHPKDTRAKIIEVLKYLQGKHEEGHFKRHDNVPL